MTMVDPGATEALGPVFKLNRGRASQCRCTGLEHLSLAGNSIGDAGATTLVHALRHCLALQTLDLSRNYIYDTGAHALVRLIDRRVVQRTLDLQGNCISQDGMDALLVAFLSSAGTLELLLRGNPGATDVPRGCPRSQFAC